MITKFNLAFTVFILIITFVSILFLDNKKIYFQSVEVGNEFFKQFGYNHSINKIVNLDTYLSELDDIVQKSNHDFIWKEDDHYLIYFFSNNLNNTDERINYFELNVKKLDNKFKQNFSNLYKNLDYLQYKMSVLNDNPQWLKNNLNIYHSIHREYILTTNLIKKINQKIINSESIIFTSLNIPKYKEYSYNNINNSFIFKSILILLISSIISFLLIYKLFIR